MEETLHGKLEALELKPERAPFWLQLQVVHHCPNAWELHSQAERISSVMSK